MADDYLKVKSGKLKFKGDDAAAARKRHKKHKKHKHRKQKGDDRSSDDEADTAAHGGWWSVSSIEHMCGTISIEMAPQVYMSSMDNGLFTLGAPHPLADEPSPEEQYTAMRINERQVAIKSGYGKYLGVTSDGVVTGRTDAVTAREQWEPVFEDGKMALQASNNCFLSCTDEGDMVARSKKVDVGEILKVRSNVDRAEKAKQANAKPSEDIGNVKNREVNYVKKFQSFQDRKLRVNEGDKVELRVAKQHGNLHEVMLDRRSKMKADRFCK